MTSKHLYDAVQFAAELENTIASLSEVIQRVEVTEGFNEVLTESQLDGVYCSALVLSAAITEYLTKTIGYLEKNLSNP